MKICITAAVCALIIAGCNSQQPKEETKTVTKIDTVVALPPDTIAPVIPKDTATVPGNEWEKIGDLSLGMKQAKTIELLGQPSSKSKGEEWGADGLTHQDWFYKNKGITLNMSSDKSFAGQEVFSISITSPCTFRTKKDIGIGSAYNEVMTAYEKDIDKTATDPATITVGSVYGGIIFNFKNDKAVKIFIGAAAE